MAGAVQGLLTPELRDTLRHALPGAALDDAEVIGEGWGSVAYRVPDAGGDRALRVPKPGSFRRVSGDLERELRLLPALAAAGLPVPREARAVHDERGRFVAAVHRYVAGRPASREALRGARRERLAADLGDFLTRLHAFPPERAVERGVQDLDLWADRYRPMIEYCRPLLGPRSAAWLAATADRFLADGGMEGAARVLTHGDLDGVHIRLHDDGTLDAVIDFGDAMVADPAIDVAAIARSLGWPFAERVLARYGGDVDRQLRRRARFYIAVVPLFSVRYGDVVRDGRERADGLRQLAARAAAATRLGGRR